ncbi:MAG: family 10 glycosylhydrolase [Ignavibacteriaceae bacterium]|nr:family 10 glycosylhydrolase [Ignavibacteriaceae bacterium]
MKKLLLLLLLPLYLFAQPKEEVRAVWLTTVYNLDWPKTSGATNQMNELKGVLDKFKAANINTVMFQVRARGDLMYPSAIEPWSKVLTGNLGQNPGYDPLQFIIDEAHARGIEVHAWWNVYKVYGTGTPPGSNPQHIVLAHPELVKLYANEWWLDPGKPETKTYLLNLAMEMVRKYNVDGIHFDFIRYPNPDFNDDATYAQYGNGVNKADWRRNNITQFVYALYDSVTNLKPMFKVGSAPIGIYKKLSNCLTGFLGYEQVYQDSRRWILAKKHDYLSPQIYWDINSCPRYDSLAIDWINNRFGRHIYAANAIYRLAPNDGNWSVSEIMAQIDSARGYGGQGQTFYRAQYLLENYKSLTTTLQAGRYKYPANIPSMSWKDGIKPLAPENISLTTGDSLTWVLSWSKPAPASDGDTAVYYNVYLDTVSPVDISDVTKMIKFRVVNDTSITIALATIPTANTFFAVTAYDKGYNESLQAETGIVFTSVKEPALPADYSLEQNYPNPFNPATIIKYNLGKGGFTTLKVYDMLGNLMGRIVETYQAAGTYSVRFDASELASGTYFYTIKSGEFRETKKMVLIR